MAYSNKTAKQIVALMAAKLATDPAVDVAAFIADADFAGAIPDEPERIALTVRRLRKEWDLNGDVHPAEASYGSYDLTGLADATGDGLVGFGFNNVTYLSSTDGGNAPAGQTAEEAAQALADSVNGYSHPVALASVAGALISFTTIVKGSGTDYAITEKSTDTTMVGGTIVNIQGGVDQSVTGDIIKGIDGSVFEGSTKV